MKNMYVPQLKAFAFFCLLTIFSFKLSAQVGIGTPTPDAGSILDVVSTNKGVLVPRVAIANLATIAPITGSSTEGLLVYNTDPSTGPGFFYWDGGAWMPIGGTGGDAWELEGNAGTDADANFVGTTDSEPLRFRTRDIERFEISDGSTQANSGRLRAFADGTNGSPVYSWMADDDTGIYRTGDNVIGFSTGGSLRFSISNGFQVLAGGNANSAALPFYSYGNDADTGMFRVGANILGFSTNGNERIRITNNQILAGTNGTESAPIYSWNGDSNTGIFNPAADNLGFSTNGIERVRVITTGDVGVGTTAPLSKLHVSIAANDRPAIFSQITANNSTWSAGEFSNPNTSGGTGITGNGNIGVYGVTTNLPGGWGGYFQGDVFMRDLYYRNPFSYSDRRVKQNFQNIENGLDIIMKLKPQKYEKLVQVDNSKSLSLMSTDGTINDGEKPEKEFGLIAQDLEIILPELVSSKQTTLKDLGTIDLKAVNYNGLIPILIQAMQEQQAQIKALQEEVKTLKAKN